MRLKPGFREFMDIRNLAHRGDVVVFRPNIRNDCYSTDSAGFRHSVFGGEPLAVRDVIQRERYGLVLGSSNIFGLGTIGDHNTIPSALGDRFGFPFANVCLPEGNSRNLFSQLSALLVRAPRPPAAVILFTGGDFTSFCFSCIADPVFGPPNLKQYPHIVEEQGGSPVAQDHIKPLLAYTALWVQAIVRSCRSARIPVLLGDDTTFFEKREPSALDIECRLGTPGNPNQVRWFAAHKLLIQSFMSFRATLAQKLGVPFAGPGMSNDYSFFDEFHYDAEGARSLSESVSPALEDLLAAPRASAA